MRLVLRILIIFNIISLWSCNTPKNQPVNIKSQTDSLITVINDSSEVFDLPIVSFWIPTEQQLIQLDSIMQIATQDSSNYTRILDFKKFYKQYVCYKDSAGNQIVYVNGFCNLMSFPIKDSSGNWKTVPFDWKKHIIKVNDGGPCFWHMQINLTKKKYFDFIINGMA